MDIGSGSEIVMQHIVEYFCTIDALNLESLHSIESSASKQL